MQAWELVLSRARASSLTLVFSGSLLLLLKGVLQWARLQRTTAFIGRLACIIAISPLAAPPIANSNVLPSAAAAPARSG